MGSNAGGHGRCLRVGTGILQNQLTRLIGSKIGHRWDDPMNLVIGLLRFVKKIGEPKDVRDGFDGVSRIGATGWHANPSVRGSSNKSPGDRRDVEDPPETSRHAHTDVEKSVA